MTTPSLLKKLSTLSGLQVALLIVVTNLFFYLFAINSGYHFCTNSRAEFFLRNNSPANKFLGTLNYEGFLPRLEKCLSQNDCKTKNLKSDDDIGSALVFWLGNKLTPKINLQNITDNDHLKFRDGHNYPMASQIFYILFHLMMLGFFGFMATRLFSPLVALFLGISLSLFENFFYISYSMDIYFFPIYLIILSLVVLDLKAQSTFKLIIIGFLIGLCCLMRSSGSIIFYAILLSVGFVCLKERNYVSLKKLMIMFCVFLICFKSPSLIFKSSTHTFWHSIHTGLYEHGGAFDQNGHPVPKHLLKENKELDFKRWDDFLIYKIVHKVNPNSTLYDEDYDKIIKESYLKLLKKDYIANLFFYFRRLPILLSFNPYKTHASLPFNNSPFGYEMYYAAAFSENYSTSAIFSFCFVIVWLIFLFSNRIALSIRVFFSSALLASLIPGFLVHPSHTIYNAPILFTQWCIIAITVYALLTHQVVIDSIDKLKKLVQA